MRPADHSLARCFGGIAACMGSVQQSGAISRRRGATEDSRLMHNHSAGRSDSLGSRRVRPQPRHLCLFPHQQRSSPLTAPTQGRCRAWSRQVCLVLVRARHPRPGTCRLVSERMQWPSPSHMCGEVGRQQVGSRISVCGWIDRFRYAAPCLWQQLAFQHIWPTGTYAVVVQ